MAANGCERSVQRKECWWQMTSNNLQATELTTCSYLSLITDNGWFLFIMVGAKRKYIISQITVDKNRYKMTCRDKMLLFMSYELCQQVSWNIFSGESFTKSLFSYVFRWPVWAYAGRPDQITRPLQVWPVDGCCFVRVAGSLRARLSTLQCSAWGEAAGQYCLPPRLGVHRHHGPLRRVKRIYLLHVHDTRTSSSGGNFRCDR